ncbi:J domain-containing protein, partial [Escherichia coli]|uniref:J domain-containing protein n=1 Tax=Escherichia coli TaxID=562 RepID=UPI000D09EDC0
MKNCWKILDIEETTDVDIIRRAYLALLPSFHPETDPQGFKQLRQAYEEALRIAQSPAKEVAIKWSAAPDMTPQTVLYRRPVAQ